MLSDTDIYGAWEKGEIGIEPFRYDQLQPASVDVRLGSEFLVMQNHHTTFINPMASHPQKLMTRTIRENGDPLVLHPGEFVLGTTVERVKLSPGYAARLEGKSSLGRLGLLTHATAGFIDPGFEGEITLELSNVATLPILLHPGMKIGQLCFFALSSPAAQPYGSEGLGSKYQGQTGATASRIHLD